MRRLSLTAALLLMLTSSVFGGLTTGTWTSVSDLTAEGSIDGITITASTNADAIFIGAFEDRFNDTSHCAGWDADYPLPASVLGLVTTSVNAGDSQNFIFSAPKTEGIFYIENFDSMSEATITVDGGTLELIAGSQSISYAASSDTSGVLSTSNKSTNGEGDAILAFSGPVTSLTIDYSSGTGDNGVFYAFGMGDPTAAGGVVPEPSSLLVWGGIGALLLLVNRKRLTGK